MIYKFVSWIRSPGSAVGIVWEDAQGILAALSEHPLVASVARCAGEASPGTVSYTHLTLPTKRIV